MAQFVGYHGLDENSISVQCDIEGCDARVNGDHRCTEHGGDPEYEWRTSAFGETSYLIRKGAPDNGTTTSSR
jgi:hypothetical protein